MQEAVGRTKKKKKRLTLLDLSLVLKLNLKLTALQDKWCVWVERRRERANNNKDMALEGNIVSYKKKHVWYH